MPPYDGQKLLMIPSSPWLSTMLSMCTTICQTQNRFNPSLIFFTSTIVPHHGIKHFLVWGSCPCYVLDPTLQNGHKLPRWQPKSRRAIFMGISPSHSSNVPLVLNLKTGTISPQFHVVLDDYFTTVMSISDSDDPPGHWEILFHESRFHTEFDEHEQVSLHGD